MKIPFTIILITLGAIWTGYTSEHSINFDDPDSNYSWKVHDPNRPLPPVVKPGAENHLPPSDAVVLFNGKDLSAWKGTKRPGQPAEWKVKNGYMEVVPETGAIETKQGFGSCQLHIEWASPEVVKGESQGRGNSGV